MLDKNGEPLAKNKALIGQIKELGFNIKDQDYARARFAFNKILELNLKDINAELIYAQFIEDGTLKEHAESRDLMLSILDEYPIIFDLPAQLRRAFCQEDKIFPQARTCIQRRERLFPAAPNSVEFFIVGADSRVGSAIDAKLLGGGRDCIGTTRRHATTTGHIHLDLSDPPESWRLPDRCDVTILVAGITSLARCDAEPALTRQVNVDHTIELARMMSDRGSQIIYVSTNLVFSGDIPDVNALSELSPQCNYARQKAEVEQALMECGKPVSIIRITKLAETLRDLLWSWALDLMQDRPIAPFSDLVCAPLRVDVLIDSIMRIGDARKTGLFQIGARPDIPYDEIARRLAKALNVRQELVHPTTSVAAGVILHAKPRYTTLQTTPPELQLELALHSDAGINMVVNEVALAILDRTHTVQAA